MQFNRNDLPAASISAGARMQTTVNNLDKAVLGTCERFEERQVRS
jgi:T-complex protein 1 subunit eta